MKTLDQIGVVASIICAIHCTLLPLIILFLPSFLISLIIHETYEWIFLLISFVIGIMSLCFGYKKHNTIKLFPILSAGFLFLVIGKHLHSNFQNNSPIIVNIFLILGALLISFSHILNSKLCNKCIKCINENKY